MGFSFFSTQASPIAVNFGASSVKLLQVSAPSTSAKTVVRAAAELPIPDEIRNDSQAMLEHTAEQLPSLLREGGFKGRKVVCTVPTQQTICLHMQIAPVAAGGQGLGGLSGIANWGGGSARANQRDELVKAQLQMQMGIAPSSIVVRTVEVAEVQREGQARTEVICFAMPRELIMRHVEMLERCKMEIVGVHTEAMAMVRAFDHIHQRNDDHKITTMYIDLGWSGTCVALSHGRQMVFARSINVGGRHFDELIASHLKTNLSGARAHRLSLEDPLGERAAHMPDDAPQMINTVAGDMSQDGGAAVMTDRRTNAAPAALQHAITPGDAPSSAANVDFTELLDTMTDEFAMCLRYHRALFPSRAVDRVVLLGGEARQQWLCRHIARGLRLPARLGDPLARLVNDDPDSLSLFTPGLALHEPQPGWAVPWGLCAAAAGPEN